jgi:hypothetical protein
MRRSPASPFFLALLAVTIPATAKAASVFVEPLTSTGLPDDAPPTFQKAIEEAFDSAGHELVKLDKAAFRARTQVKKDRSRYDMTIRIATAPGGRVVIEKDVQCAPCTLDQAEQQLRLLVRTVSLNLSDIEDAAGRAGAPTPPVAPKPSSPATAPPSTPGPPKAPRQPPTAAPRYEPSAWYRTMRWTAIVPGVSGVIAGIYVTNHAVGRDDCGPDRLEQCPKDYALFSLGIASWLMAEFYAVWNALDLALPNPSPDGRAWSTGGAWLGLGATAALGTTSYLLLKNDGYGSDFAKTIAFANIPLAALAATTSIGTLIAPNRPVESSVTMLIAPGFFGVGGTF